MCLDGQLIHSMNRLGELNTSATSVSTPVYALLVMPVMLYSRGSHEILMGRRPTSWVSFAQVANMRLRFVSEPIYTCLLTVSQPDITSVITHAPLSNKAATTTQACPP